MTSRFSPPLRGLWSRIDTGKAVKRVALLRDGHRITAKLISGNIDNPVFANHPGMGFPTHAGKIAEGAKFRPILRQMRHIIDPRRAKTFSL